MAWPTRPTCPAGCRWSKTKTAELWLYSLDMDMMIHGGKPLPAELLAEAMEVKDMILAILNRAAEGDF